MFAILPPGQLVRLGITNNVFSMRIELEVTARPDNDIGQMRMERREVPDLDLGVGWLTTPDTINEVARVPVLTVNQFFGDQLMLFVVNLVAIPASVSSRPTTDMHYSFRAVYGHAILLSLHSVRVPDTHLENDRLVGVVKGNVHRIGCDLIVCEE